MGLDNILYVHFSANFELNDKKIMTGEGYRISKN